MRDSRHKNVCLSTELKSEQHMFVQSDQTPEEITKACDSQSKFHCNRICMRINKGMHGLQEAGSLTKEQLRQHLASCGCRPAPHTPGLWNHDSNKITFALVADDFGVKCFTNESAEHLIAALKEKHKDMEVNWNTFSRGRFI